MTRATMMGRGADGDADDDTYVRGGAAREGPGVGGAPNFRNFGIPLGAVLD